MQIEKPKITWRDYYKNAFWCGHCGMWILKAQLLNGFRCPYCNRQVRRKKRFKRYKK